MKFKWTYLIAFQAILFVVFLLITFYFNRFAADDYYFIGELKTSSFKEIYSQLYYEWHGRWTSNFLLVYFLKFHQAPMFLMIYNLLSVGLLYIGVTRLLNSINNYYHLNLSKKLQLIYGAISISVLFFCTISANDTWLWYTSSIVYLWSTAAFFWGMQLFFTEKKNFFGYLILGVSTIYIGGSNEPLTLLTILLLLYLIFKRKEITVSGLGIILLSASFLINYLSPGTLNRDEITPHLGFIDLVLYTGYSSVKFLLFSIYKTFIPALFLGVPFYLLGKRINTPLVKNFKPIKELVWGNVIIIGAVFLNQLIVVYALGALSPDRSGMASTILIAIIVIRYLFLLGNYHQEKNAKLKYVLVLNVLALIVFNLYFAHIHSIYSKVVDGRNGYILICKSPLIIKVDPLPFSGYIYSAEITDNPDHFKNQHLKKGLGVNKDIVLVYY